MEAGFGGRTAARKLLLRPQIKKKKNFSGEKIIEQMIFQIFGSMMKQCVVPTVTHGGSKVMVWGCFRGNNTFRDIVKIDRITTKEVYLGILKNHNIPSGSRINGEAFIFQEDDPKHPSKFYRNHLSELENDKIIERMIWLTKSSDLSPIELLWDEFDRIVKKVNPQD